MSYATFLAEPNSSKQTLVEIDIGESIIWVNYAPGIWTTTYSVNSKNKSFNFGSGCFGFGAFGTSGTADLGNGNPRKRIGSIWVDGEHLTRRNTLADVQINEKSFYFDPNISQLFATLDNFDPPNAFDSIQIGVTQGYSNRSSYWNDTYYDGRLISLPQVGHRKDPLFYGLLRFEGGDISLDNTDGEFDDFATRNVFGQQCRILFGSPDLSYASYETIFTGYIEDFTLEGDQIQITIQDPRKALSRTLPVNVFDSETYPDIEDNNIGKGIPIAYGEIRNAPVVCTNEALSAAIYNFKLADTTYHPIKAITTVWVEGSSGSITACSAGTVNLNAATFTLNNTKYEPGRDVTVDFSGYANASGVLIENGLDIIRDLLENIAGISYDAVNYDTVEWMGARSAAPDMGVFIDSEQDLYQTIENICNSVPGVFLVKDDGRFTFKIYNASRSVAKTIHAEELLEPPSIHYESEEYLTSILIRYSKDWAEDKWKSHTDSSRESSTFSRYKVRRQRTFETLLTGLTAATAFGTLILDRSDTIEPIFTLRMKTQNLDLELEDMVIAEIYISPSRTYGMLLCEVLGIEKDLMNFVVTLTLRRIVEAVEEQTVYCEGSFYGDDIFYGDSFYGISGEQ